MSPACGASASTVWKTTLLGVGLFLAGSGYEYVMPAYLGEIGQALHLSATQVGWLSGVETAAVGLSSLTVGLTLGRIPWRRFLALAALIAAVGDLAVGLMPNYPALVALRGLVGLLGEGPTFAIGCVVLGGLPSPERGFGVALTAVAVLSAAIMAITWPVRGGELLVFGLIALALAPALVTAKIDALASAEAAGPSPRRPDGERSCFDLLLAQGAWYAAPGLFWAFAGQAASAAGFSAAGIASALSIASLAGIAGALLPIWVGGRWRHLPAILASTAGLCVSVLVFQTSHLLLLLTVSLSAFNIFWNVAAVYEPALIATADSSGRAAAFVPLSQLGGMSIGPIVAGAAIDAAGMGVLSYAVAGFAVVGAGIFLVASRRRRLSPPAGPDLTHGLAPAAPD